MLLSMTGFGDGRASADGFAVTAEVRAVNNRHLKVTVRGSDPYPLHESEVEKVVRRHVKRGTLTVNLRAERVAAAADYRIDAAVLGEYLKQVVSACRAAGHPAVWPHLLAGVLTLPGVSANGGGSTGLPEGEWPVAEQAIEMALKKLTVVRREEGRAMTDELMSLHRRIGEELGRVREVMPVVMTNYRARLLDRVRQAITAAGVTADESNLIRELALFADRSDVAEEMTRLAAHLDSFADIVANETDSPGRRLEFVVQEMGREANTLGSKAGDVTVSRHAVEIKAALEKIRELVLNVE